MVPFLVASKICSAWKSRARTSSRWFNPWPFFIHVSYRSRSQPLSYKSRELTIPKKVTCSWSLVPGRQGAGSWKQRGPPAGQHQRCFCSRNVPFGDGFKLVGVGGVCFLCCFFLGHCGVFCLVCELHEPFKAKWTTWTMDEESWR